MAMKRFSTLLAVLIIASAPAWAVLGEPVASVHTDQQRTGGKLRAVNRAGYTVQQITQADGVVVEEYVSPAGIVFGVSWRGPVMPRLADLLGSYFQNFQQQSRSAARRRRAVVLRSDRVVVESGGHPRGFHGRAYVPSLVPGNVSPAVIQ